MFLLEVEGEFFFFFFVIESIFICISVRPFSWRSFFSFQFCSKFKVARGGGRHFSRDLDPRFNKPVSESSEEESSEEEEESSEEDETIQNQQLAPEMAALNLKLGNTVALDDDEDQEAGMSRAERKAMKKAQGQKKVVTIQEPEDSGSESDEEEVVPAPAPKGKGKPAKKVEPVQMSRKERWAPYVCYCKRNRADAFAISEAAEKKAAEQRYQNLHAQGEKAC